MSFEETERKVLGWAIDRELFKQSGPRNQLVKLHEEFTELSTAIDSNNRDDVIDAIGDMMVVLTMISHMYYTNLTACYNSAYEEIKDRKGKMINGLFVKEN